MNWKFGFAVLFGAGLLIQSSAKVHGQNYVVYAPSPQVPSPQAWPVQGGGCYTGTVPPPSGYSCYTITQIPSGNSCYVSVPQPSTPPDMQHPAMPQYEVLCHDVAYVTQKVTLRRYYPVYIHLKAVPYEGVEVTEEWKPLCVLCTKDKPCPKHKAGQGADLPPPADPSQPAPPPGAEPSPAPPTKSSDANKPVTDGTVMADPTIPMIFQVSQRETVAPGTTADQGLNSAPIQAAAPALPAQPAQSTVAAAATETGKRWVYYAQYNAWGYGKERPDGQWDIDPNSWRR